MRCKVLVLQVDVNGLTDAGDGSRIAAMREKRAAGPSLSARQRKAIRTSIARWYRSAGRDLPWRRDPSPYRVWISEIMAQQTRLETVQPYFERFLRLFPSVSALAHADLDTVLAAWSGLGYYRRARNLHSAARIVDRKLGGRLPRHPEQLVKLPGVGRYTAGAIASLAYGEPAPVLDGNVTRLLCRLVDLDADIGLVATREKLWSLAGALVAEGNASEINQGLMDLGALICTPRTPSCPVCPLERLCLARRAGNLHKRPVKRPRKPPSQRSMTAAAIWLEHPARIVLVKNPDRGLLAGLWMLPSCPPPWDLDRGPHARRDTLGRRLHAMLGVEVRVGRSLGKLEHVLTHRALRIHVLECHCSARPLRATGYDALRFVDPRRIPPALALPTLTRKLTDLAAGLEIRD